MPDTYVVIDIDTIRNNIRELKKIDENAKFAAVVKANAYGLGALTISKEIEDLADYYCVARFSEANQLRINNIKKPILILGYVSLDDVKECVELDIDIPIYDLEYAKKINDVIQKPINAHIALDTGHGRIGFREFEIDKIKPLKDLKNINIISAFSHFSTADEADISYTNLQNERFNKIVEECNELFSFDFVHIANDAGAIKHKISKDMIRCGISMYGIYPSNFMKEENDINLEQCFEINSTISFIKNVYKGEFISYGRTFEAKNEMKVATVSIGYADGFLRAFSNRGEVLIKDKLCKVLGRVCMDQIMVDVSNLDCKIGDSVKIYPDIYKEANKSDTIVYELMTSINMRVPRIYKKDGKIFKKIDYFGEIHED